jgi:hypothetical protein
LDAFQNFQCPQNSRATNVRLPTVELPQRSQMIFGGCKASSEKIFVQRQNDKTIFFGIIPNRQIIRR